MRAAAFAILLLGHGHACAENPRLASMSKSGILMVENTLSNGVCTLYEAASVNGAWQPHLSVCTTNSVTPMPFERPASHAFYRAGVVDLSNGRPGFTNLALSYSTLTTVAGAGGSTASANQWQPSFEHGPATNALLSRPHIAMADDAMNIYIADKDAHAVRKVRPDGSIVTVAGNGAAGNGADTPAPGNQVALTEPNGLWVRADGTVYILDMGNGKIRKLENTGMVSTLFSVPGGIASGRGLWVSADESLAYVASATVVKKWTPSSGVSDYASGFAQLGNIAVDPKGRLVVTDRNANLVYRLEENGGKTIIAGNGAISGGGDGQSAISTGLNQARAVWFLPSGAFFVGTDNGSQVWYVDTAGRIHLFLNGSSSNSHAGDGAWFYQPGEFRVSKIRAITTDREGNLLITEHDAGYVRKVRFLPQDS